MFKPICWIERWWVSGTLRPNLPKQVWARSRAMPDRADGAATGLYSRRSRTEAAFTGLRPAPHPVAALSLSVALGRDPAVAPTPHAPAVNRCAGRVTSLEKLYPGTWLTFNALCKQNQGWIESRQGANNPSPGSLLFAVQKAATLAGVAAFAFVGLRNVLASYNQNLGKPRLGSSSSTPVTCTRPITRSLKPDGGPVAEPWP